MKQAFLAYVNQAQIRSWNKPVLSNDGKVYCSRKQREHLMGFELTTDHLRVRRSKNCSTAPLLSPSVYVLVLYIPSIRLQIETFDGDILTHVQCFGHFTCKYWEICQHIANTLPWISQETF